MVSTETLFGSSFEETRQHSPLLTVSGLLANRDRPTSPGYAAYHVDGFADILSVWTETRDTTNNIALRCRTYAYGRPYDMLDGNEITVYAECHEIK